MEKMEKTKIAFIEDTLYLREEDQKLIDSFKSDIQVIRYQNDLGVGLSGVELSGVDLEMSGVELSGVEMSGVELELSGVEMSGVDLELSGIDLSKITQVGFFYHYKGHYTFPFFKDKVQFDKSGNRIHSIPKYHYFSDLSIEVFKKLKGDKADFIIDLVSCNLNIEEFKKEVSEIENDLGINIRYSVDETGNNENGSNWILESDNVNIRDEYFTEDILLWDGVLSTNITANIKNGDYSDFFNYDETTKTFTLLQSFTLQDESAVANDFFIELSGNEVFDGQDYTIDLQGITNWIGMFSVSHLIDSSLNTVIIKNLGLLNGTTKSSDGAFHVIKEKRFFRIENCYSTGTISYGSGGIIGAGGGYLGYCEVKNCYSTGPIGSDAGGIGGFYLCNTGVCKITDCYSTGSISSGGGGIVGSNGGFFGECIIKNCYSTGSIEQNGGGIAGSSGGFNGTCNISNCYSTGVIGDYAGGIAGSNYGIYGTGSITNCFSTGTISFGGGGIAGSNAGKEGSCNIENCYSNGEIGKEAGGIIGFYSAENGGNVNINSCYSTGVIGDFAGGIAGSNLSSSSGDSLINSCFSTGSIGIGGGGITGSQTGNLNGVYKIQNCYSTGSIGNNAGGIVGESSKNNGDSKISNCFSTGLLSSNLIYSGLGGIYGLNSTITVEDTYYNSAFELNFLNNQFPSNSWNTSIWEFQNDVIIDIYILNSSETIQIGSGYIDNNFINYLENGTIQKQNYTIKLPILRSFKTLNWISRLYKKIIDTPKFSSLNPFLFNFYTDDDLTVIQQQAEEVQASLENVVSEENILSALNGEETSATSQIDINIVDNATNITVNIPLDLNTQQEFAVIANPEQRTELRHNIIDELFNTVENQISQYNVSIAQTGGFPGGGAPIGFQTPTAAITAGSLILKPVDIGIDTTNSEVTEMNVFKPGTTGDNKSVDLNKNVSNNKAVYVNLSRIDDEIVINDGFGINLTVVKVSNNEPQYRINGLVNNQFVNKFASDGEKMVFGNKEYIFGGLVIQNFLRNDPTIPRLKPRYKCWCPYTFLKQNTSTNQVQISNVRRIANRLWYNKNLR